MHQAAHNTQIISLFGGSYVPEQRTNEMPDNLAPPDIAEATSLTGFLFGEVMQSLRSALCVKSGHLA